MLPFAQDLFAVGISDLWYAVPLIVSVSLVYAATRHELPELIAGSAIRTAVWIVGFLLVGLAVMFLMNTQV